ncbi:MAG TPA: bifunctional phosphoglucose/phosphomannose isomerase [Candidatus Dormibacteraeota bacterium]|nr:bifunctional phosphoglucose/phosphomannose isomerase [Candidatus Dormibacteraeota bacterium]
MLDDLKLIHSRDGEDALGITRKQPTQYRYAYNFKWTPSKTINNFVIAGMGGSGLAAKLLSIWPNPELPVQIVQDYNLPNYVSENTLLVLVSYSGNTEEIISILIEALSLEKPPMIVVVCSGGQLEEIANKYKLPSVKLPAGYQPRMTFGYQLRALAEIIEQSGLSHGLIGQLETASLKLESLIDDFIETKSVSNNLAKQIALEIVGKSVVVYSSAKFFPVAYKWKISINENAKTISWANQFPEFNHNEFIGWTSHPVDKPYAVIELRSNLDHPEILKRFVVTEQLLSGKKPAAEVIDLKGDALLDQIMYGIVLGDFVSIYLAILNGIDPTPVDIIETFKSKLK